MAKAEADKRCPDCGAVLNRHARSFEGNVYQCVNSDCENHARFGIARAPESEGFWEEPTRVQIRALKRARRSRRRGDEFPVVTIGDL